MTIREKMKAKIKQAKENGTIVGTREAQKALEMLETFTGNLNVILLRGAIKIIKDDQYWKFGEYPAYPTPEECSEYCKAFYEAVENAFSQKMLHFTKDFPKTVQIRLTPSPYEQGKQEGIKCAEKAVQILEKTFLETNTKEISIVLFRTTVKIRKDEEHEIYEFGKLFAEQSDEERLEYRKGFYEVVEERFKKEGIIFEKGTFMRTAKIDRSFFD